MGACQCQEGIQVNYDTLQKVITISIYNLLRVMECAASWVKARAHFKKTISSKHSLIVVIMTPNYPYKGGSAEIRLC